jgi:hypothetical protein
MKQKIYIFGVITTLIVFTGTIFKISHFPGANILLSAGLLTLVLVFIPVALINHYNAQEQRQNKALYIVTWLTCFLVFTSMLFKIQHWPFAGILLMVALPFPYVVFLPVFLGVTSKNKNFNIYNVVFVLSLLAFNSVVSSMIALNVSKEKIEDSYNLSRNYNKLGMVQDQLPDPDAQTAVDLKINEVLKTIKDYQELILKSEGLSWQKWRNDPGNLWRPDAKAVAAEVLIKAEGLPVGGRLESGLKSLISEMRNTKGCEGLAKAAPVIFGIAEPTNNKTAWGESTFRESNLSWALTYLDGLETNLRMIKISAGKNY